MQTHTPPLLKELQGRCERQGSCERGQTQKNASINRSAAPENHQHKRKNEKITKRLKSKRISSPPPRVLKCAYHRRSRVCPPK